MARIYSSRTLLDPENLQTLNRESESRLNRDIERRRNVLGATQNLLGSAGKTIDEQLKKQQEEEDYRKRYSDVAWNTSPEQMRDPLYRAALEEYARTGSAGPLSNYQLARETQASRVASEERAKLDAEAAERKRKEAEAAAAYPSYLEAITKSIEANKAGNKKEALIYSEQAGALQKKHGFTDAALTGLFEAEESEKELAEARKEEEEYQKEQAKEQAKLSREMRDFVELNFIPTTMKGDEDKQYSARIVNSLKSKLTDEDYKYLMDKVLGKKTTAEAVSEATQGAVAGAAGKQVTKTIEEKEELDRIRDKKAQGIPLSSREQQLLNEAEAQ